MFTGIITDVGRIKAILDKNGIDRRMEIETAYDLQTVALGASICCSGVCLTVVEKAADWFAVDVSGETLSVTALSDWTQGSRINLERSLKIGDELGGHIVQGHVDGVGEVRDRQLEQGSIRFNFGMPKSLAGFVAKKGSITVDGVSLTVNDVGDDWFTVNIVPHTQTETNFGDLRPGSRVNLEIDVLARYVARTKQVSEQIVD